MLFRVIFFFKNVLVIVFFKFCFGMSALGLFYLIALHGCCLIVLAESGGGRVILFLYYLILIQKIQKKLLLCIIMHHCILHGTCTRFAGKSISQIFI